MVEIAPDRELTPLLLDLFHTLGDWLTANRLASLEVHFDDRTYTLLRPSDALPSHSAEFLLQRVIQLQTALESRVVIERAVGLLAGRLRLALEEAFEVMRHAARSAGRQLHELAEDVISSEELPAEIRHAVASWRSRR